MQVQINHISPCRSIMRAVLSSLVLLFGSAMAIPSLLRTGQSDKNDNGIIIMMIIIMILIMISGMVREGREREGWQWGGGQSLLLMMQLWGESDDERFSNQPKSKHSGGSQWSREVCKHFVRTKAKYHPRRYNLLPVFFTCNGWGFPIYRLPISSILLYLISLTWMKTPNANEWYYLVGQQTKQLPILDKIFVGPAVLSCKIFGLRGLHALLLSLFTRK